MVQAKILGIGNNTFEAILINSESACSFGREEEENIIVCDNKAISGQHAVISYKENNFIVEDLGSLTGTYVGEQKIGQVVENPKKLFDSGEHSQLRELNKGLEKLVEGSIIHLGKDAQTEDNKEEFDYRYLFSLNPLLDTFFIDRVVDRGFSISETRKVVFEDNTYLYQNV